MLSVPPMAAPRDPAPDLGSEFYKRRVFAIIATLRQQGKYDPKTLGEAQNQILIIVEDARRAGGAQASSGSIAEVKSHFAKAKERYQQGQSMVEVLDELEAAIVPILERLEARIATLEVTVGQQQQTLGGQQQKIDGQQEEIGGLKQRIDGQQQEIGGLKQENGGLKQVVGSLVERQADTDALLDLRQMSILLQLEVTQDFLHEPKKFGDLNQSQRAQLLRDAKSVFQIPDRFGVDGGNFVHRRQINAGKIKAYILKEFGDEFTEHDVDSFLEYRGGANVRNRPFT